MVKGTFFNIPAIFERFSIGYLHTSAEREQMTVFDAKTYCSDLGASLWAPNSWDEVEMLIFNEWPELSCKFFAFFNRLKFSSSS